MATIATKIKIPTPLRAYTGNQAEVGVQGETVGQALTDLLGQYPDLRTQLYEGDRLRNFVNVFVGEEDIRYRDGLETELSPGDQLRIIPSIAGGSSGNIGKITNGAHGAYNVQNGLRHRMVDHSAIRTAQASLIVLLIAGFVLNTWLLVALTSVALAVSAINPRLSPFRFVYSKLLQPSGLVRPAIKLDNPEPHRFSQAVGATVTALATIALLLNIPLLGWLLAWLVVGLAALNLFAGICVGCLMYYQFSRLKVPGFTRLPLQS